MTPTNAFDIMLSGASRSGCSELLGDMKSVREVFLKTLIGDMLPVALLEFPLSGKTKTDIFSFYWNIPSNIAINDINWYHDMFEWYKNVHTYGTTCIGLTMESDKDVGAYFQYRDLTEYIPDFFESIGLSDRTNDYMSVKERFGEGWGVEYAGFFPSRNDVIRIGGYMSQDESDRCANDMVYLSECFNCIGYKDYDNDMLSLCQSLMSDAYSVDFQFDIMQDGSIGDTFGLSLAMPRINITEMAECFRTGYGYKKLSILEDIGVVDDRWRLLENMTFLAVVDGVYMWVCPSHVKVKFVDCIPQKVKAYTAMSAVDNRSFG